MQGARDYFSLFSGKSFQEGKLLVKFGSHARGTTMQIYVVTPEYKDGARGWPNTRHGVEVYGIKGGQPGWTEFYGWLREGPWQEDFMRIVERKREHRALESDRIAKMNGEAIKRDAAIVADILGQYGA